MEGVRQRKLGGDIEVSSMGLRTAGSGAPSFRLLKLLFYFITFSLTALIVLVTINNMWPWRGASHRTSYLDRVSVALGVQESAHAVVIDAGSTGSRVLAFTFFRSLTDKVLRLRDELWHEVKPGLSSYADDPVEGAKSLLKLLELARGRIPKEHWKSTPLVLKATAGLRLLPEEKAEALLREVHKVLSESGFHVTDNSVGIMDGMDEGIFSWFTVNYLMDRIGDDPSNTMVALDLGGGSTQITFVPMEEDTLKETPKDYLTSISLLHKNINLYTHSYLNLGLMAGRHNVLKHHLEEGGSVVHSPCINPIVKTKWTYNGDAFTVMGSQNPKHLEIKGQAGRLTENRPIADYEECAKTCLNVIGSKVNAVPELQKRDIIAFSYFFDRATERGLIDPFKGGVLTVQDFAQAARQSCEIPNTEQAFACLDLTYIAVFLHHGYGLKPTHPVKLYKKIDGYEISWALGLAFHVINNGI